MSTHNLVALRTKDIDPHVIVQTLTAEVGDFHQMYVVAFCDEGPRVYATGDLAQLALAALCLHDVSLKYLNGEVEEEIVTGPEGGA